MSEERLERVETKVDRLETKVDRLDDKVGRLDARFDRLETRVDGLDTKFDRLETKVDGLDTRLGALETTVRDGFEQVCRSMGEGFAEHRLLMVEHVDGRLDELRTELGGQIHSLGLRLDHTRDELRSEFGHGLQALRQDLQSEMRAGFGGLDAKLGEFIATQSAFNRWVMERLGEG